MVGAFRLVETADDAADFGFLLLDTLAAAAGLVAFLGGAAFAFFAEAVSVAATVDFIAVEDTDFALLLALGASTSVEALRLGGMLTVYIPRLEVKVRF